MLSEAGEKWIFPAASENSFAFRLKFTYSSASGITSLTGAEKHLSWHVITEKLQTEYYQNHVI